MTDYVTADDGRRIAFDRPGRGETHGSGPYTLAGELPLWETSLVPDSESLAWAQSQPRRQLWSAISVPVLTHFLGR